MATKMTSKRHLCRPKFMIIPKNFWKIIRNLFFTISMFFWVEEIGNQPRQNGKTPLQALSKTKDKCKQQHHRPKRTILCRVAGNAIEISSDMYLPCPVIWPLPYSFEGGYKDATRMLKIAVGWPCYWPIRFQYLCTGIRKKRLDLSIGAVVASGIGGGKSI